RRWELRQGRKVQLWDRRPRWSSLNSTGEGAGPTLRGIRHCIFAGNAERFSLIAERVWHSA
ncbi:MAG: hypothetical protein U9Q79_04315, partial [Candidatus Hydrogenedentes bacterium]|nr:hypothetical protein [Candidatus Hydrogenedentota bacterium]